MSCCGFVFQLLPLQARAGSSDPGLVWESELHRYGAVQGDLGWELPRGICHQCSGVLWQEGKVLDAFCQSCLRDAHPTEGVFCTPLGWAGEWGLCWLPLLQYWATGLVLSSAASALLQRKRSTI